MSSGSAGTDRREATLHLCAFGELRLERRYADGRVETAYRAGKVLGLLLFLSERMGVPTSRAMLADRFWGDEAPDRSRASLRQAVVTLHRLLGDGALHATREALALQADALTTDLAQAEAAYAAVDAEGFVAVYRGPFLADEPHVGGDGGSWVEGERSRWRRYYLQTLDAGITAAKRRGDATTVRRLARAVQIAEPDEELGVVTLADLAVDEGRFREAQALLEAWVAGRAQRPLAPAVLNRLRRLQETSTAGVTPVHGSTSLSGVGTELVGRTALLTTLLQVADAARTGGLPLHLLSGPAGIGKSRLLSELDARLQRRGVRMIRLKASSPMRHVAWAGMADLVRELAGLPGAGGVDTTAATTLVEFLPELRERFPGAPQATIPTADLPRRRVEALRELVQAVSEQRLVVVLLDDLHYLDAESLTATLSLRECTGARLTVIATTREFRERTIAGFTSHDVPPLTADDVRALLTAVAPLPTAPWVDAFVNELQLRGLGRPGHIIDIVHAFTEVGALTVAAAGWERTDDAREWPWEQTTDAVRTSLAELSSAARDALSVLAVWGRPMPESMLIGVVGMFRTGGAEHLVMDALAELERTRLVLARWTSWSLASDRIAERLGATQPEAYPARVLDACISWALVTPALTERTLEQIAQLCGMRRDLDAARRLVVGRLRMSGPWGSRMDGPTMVRRVIRAAGQPAWEVELLRSIGWLARQSRARLGWLAAAATLALSLGAIVAWLAWPRLVIEVEPMGEAFGRDSTHAASAPYAPFYVQPRVAVANRLGYRFRSWRGAVRVRGLDGRIVGDSVQPLDGGRAQFTRLGLVFEAWPTSPSREGARLRLMGPGLVMGTTVHVRGVVPALEADWRIVTAVVNGVALDSTRRATVAVGDSVHVRLTFEYTTTAATANYVVAGAPSWLPPQTGAVRVAGLPRPVREAWQTVAFTLPGRPVPGHGHLVLVFGGEDTADHLSSATNWSVGSPVWGDGNDLAEVPEAAVQSLRRERLITIPKYLYGSYAGRLAYPVIGDSVERGGIAAGPVYTAIVLRGDAIEFEFTSSMLDSGHEGTPHRIATGLR